MVLWLMIGAGATGCSDPARKRITAPEVPALATARSVEHESIELQNPLILQRADAQILRHSDGSYLFAATVPEYDRIELRRADTLPGLREAPGVIVWRRHTSGVMAAHIWAPEIHFIDGRWYIHGRSRLPACASRSLNSIGKLAAFA